jgi:hypothetical protein
MPTLCDTLATHDRVEAIIKRLADIKRAESTLAAERMSLLAELSSLRPADPEITLMRDGNLSRREARDTVNRHSTIDTAPVFGDALSTGDISVAHIDGLSSMPQPTWTPTISTDTSRTLQRHWCPTVV